MDRSVAVEGAVMLQERGGLVSSSMSSCPRLGPPAHLGALAQHVQLLHAVSAQVPQAPLSQQEVLMGLAHQREGQVLDPQPQSAHLLRERLPGSQAPHSTVGLLQGQRLLPGFRLPQRPT